MRFSRWHAPHRRWARWRHGKRLSFRHAPATRYVRAGTAGLTHHPIIAVLLGFPLRALVTSLTVWLLRFSGVYALAEGTALKWGIR